ncbi:MAG: type II toxin-antitoxin system PemK/MazF family toxin [Elusimicrobiota bacterium]|jgi:mRNA interferase MazF|nr:type II toxin-antitoxin system PemK/MazF family toxin [Elusimicrobiota bacterium]
MKRAEIYWVSLDPTIGTETKKTRPALILSNNICNTHLTRLIIAPITSNTDKIFAFEAKIIVNCKQNKVMLDQIRVVDKTRIGGYIGKITDKELIEVEKSLKLVLDL